MRFKILSVFGAFLLAGTAVAAELTPDLKPSDLRVFGNPAHQTMLYVFSSLTCPHCATFHKTVLPQLKEKYVDTDKAKLVMVDMPFDAKAITGTLIARCVKPANYEGFMNAMYQNQSFWTYMSNARETMMGYTKLLGELEQDINACIANKSLQKTISNQRDNLGRMHKVQGTPAIVAVQNGQSKHLTGVDTTVILNELNTFLGVTNDN